MEIVSENGLYEKIKDNNEQITLKNLVKSYEIHKICHSGPTEDLVTVLRLWWPGPITSTKKFIDLTRTVFDLLN